MTVRKEKVEVVYHFYKCIDSGEQFTTDELDNINTLQAYNAYRSRMALPFPDEIKEIRKRYGISAAKMSGILGFGANVYRNYETGEIPNQSNARLMQMAQDPEKFKELVQISGIHKRVDSGKLLKHIEGIIEGTILKPYRLTSSLRDYFFGTSPVNIFSGYKKNSLEKFTAMVIFFSARLEPWKTKLNKLLFYADFLHFKKTCFSISGLNYRAIEMGPVPNNFNTIFDYLENADLIKISRTEFLNGGIGEQFKPHPATVFNPTLFNDAEMQSLNEIITKLGKTSTEEIINLSHHEKAWQENYEAGRKMISYESSFDLKAV